MKLTLLFDLDGTLIDSRYDIAGAINFAMQHQAGHEVPIRRILPYIGSTLEATFEGLLSEPTPELIGLCIETYKHHYYEHCTENTSPFPGVAATLARLDGHLRGVVTTKRTFMAKRVLREVGLAHQFDLILGTEEDIDPKPDPAVIFRACKMLGIEPVNAAVVGDTLHDMRAAKAAGCRSIAVTYGFGDPRELIAFGPDAVIDSFDQLLRVLAETA